MHCHGLCSNLDVPAGRHGEVLPGIFKKNTSTKPIFPPFVKYGNNLASILVMTADKPTQNTA